MYEITADTTVYSRVRGAYFAMNSSWDAPTTGEQWALQQAEGRLQEALTQINQLFADDVAAFRAKVEAAGLSFLQEEEPLAMPEDGKR